jgi:hypothetical protein
MICVSRRMLTPAKAGIWHPSAHVVRFDEAAIGTIGRGRSSARRERATVVCAAGVRSAGRGSLATVSKIHAGGGRCSVCENDPVLISALKRLAWKIHHGENFAATVA